MFTSERQQLVQEAKVFVKNIPVTVSVKELHDHFTKVSSKLFVHVNTDEKGKRLNFGFVHYMDAQDAQAAIDQLSDSELKGQKLQLSRWVVKETRQIVQNETRRNLYIRNLPLLKKKNIENSLKTLLSPHGEIESMLVKKAPKLNTYYALVSFKEPQAAQNALKDLTSSSATISGSTEPLSVSWYQRKNERKTTLSQQFNAIFFSNLKEGVNDQNVRDAFGAFGRINKVMISLSEGQEQNVQKGYVVFEDEEDTEKALEASRTDPNIKSLFLNEPALELTFYKVNSSQKKTRNSKFKNSHMKNFPPNQEPFMSMPIPPHYVNGTFPNFYVPCFPMYYYPPFAPGFIPMYPNNMFMIPPEGMMDPVDMVYPGYDYYPPCLECEYEEYAQRNSSVTSTSASEQEAKQSSVNSPTTLEEEINEEVISPERPASTEESDSAGSGKEEGKEKLNSKLSSNKKQRKKEDSKNCGKSKRKYTSLSAQKSKNV